ncbi:hypothetical protein ABI59_02145 [Acidobacteria bacterium Mor1]|nr:hypothetical protein ABI59_02145 [Acidobacteria bacterium Mor1]
MFSRDRPGSNLDPPPALPRRLQPREKLAARGVEVLSLTDLVALVLGSGTREHPVERLSRRLVATHGLDGLAGLSGSEWRNQAGLGPVAAGRLAAAFELGRRAWDREGRPELPAMTRPARVFEQVKGLCTARKEQLVGLYLDAQNGLIHRETLSVGSLNTTRTHPREILFPAIEHLAAGFILVHNHPSGSLEPSGEDLDFTEGARRAGELLGIPLLDHLIVSRRGYVSLRERGLM